MDMVIICLLSNIGPTKNGENILFASLFKPLNIYAQKLCLTIESVY